MIKGIFKKCEYLIERKRCIFILMVFVILSFVLTSAVSFGFENERLSIIKPIHEISLLSNEQIVLNVHESSNENIDNYLKEYAEYYGLDSNKVISFARSITNDYTIDFNDVSGKITSDTLEGKSMLFVYYLSRDKLSKPLKDYDLSINYFKLTSNKTTMGKDQMLDNGLTFSQFLGKICDNLGVDKNYVLAISYLETGKNTSSLALKNNNFGGLRSSGSYFTYPSPEMGIIAMVLNLKGYEKYNFNNIYELSGVYTHGNKSNPSSTWVNKVNMYYNEIINNQAKYFLIEDI